MFSRTMTDSAYSTDERGAASIPIHAESLMTANELAVLANALIDELEAGQPQRSPRQRRWRSPDGLTEVLRRSKRVSRIDMVEYSHDACYSQIIIEHDGRQCFANRDLVWPGVSADMEQMARISVPRQCVANLLSFHRQHGTWINDVYQASSAKRIPAKARTASLDDYVKRPAHDPALIRQRIYPTRPSAIHRLFRP